MCVVLIGTDFEMFAWLEDFVDAVSDPGFLSRKSWVLKGMVSPLSFYRHSHGEGIKGCVPVLGNVEEIHYYVSYRPPAPYWDAIMGAPIA